MPVGQAHPDAVLAPVAPEAVVAGPIRPGEHTHAALLTVLPLAVIPVAWPQHWHPFSRAVHYVVAAACACPQPVAYNSQVLRCTRGARLKPTSGCPARACGQLATRRHTRCRSPTGSAPDPRACRSSRGPKICQVRESLTLSCATCSSTETAAGAQVNMAADAATPRRHRPLRTLSFPGRAFGPSASHLPTGSTHVKHN